MAGIKGGGDGGDSGERDEGSGRIWQLSLSHLKPLKTGFRVGSKLNGFDSRCVKIIWFCSKGSKLDKGIVDVSKLSGFGSYWSKLDKGKSEASKIYLFLLFFGGGEGVGGGKGGKHHFRSKHINWWTLDFKRAQPFLKLCWKSEPSHIPFCSCWWQSNELSNLDSKKWLHL